MCLSTVYEVINGDEKKLCEYISGVQVDNDNITLTDIMGTQTVVKGHIASVDLVKNTILIEQ